MAWTMWFIAVVVLSVSTGLVGREVAKNDRVTNPNLWGYIAGGGTFGVLMAFSAFISALANAAPLK